MASASTWTTDDINFWVSSTSGAARNPAGWLYSAETLGRAAAELRKVVTDDFANLRKIADRALSLEAFDVPPVGIGPVMVMLLGFQLENLAKGLIVARDPDKLNGSGKNPTAIIDGIKKHLGDQLLEDAKVVLSSAEQDQVKRLGTFLLWAGRYPVATKAMAMAYGHPDPPPASWSFADLAVIDALIERVRNDLMEACVVRSAFDDAHRQKELRDERPAVIAALEVLRKEVQDGVVLYYDDTAPDEPGSHLCCVACQATLVLNRHRPGGICRCGSLHRAHQSWDGSLQRQTISVVTYPAD